MKWKRFYFSFGGGHFIFVVGCLSFFMAERKRTHTHNSRIWVRSFYNREFSCLWQLHAIIVIISWRRKDLVLGSFPAQPSPCHESSSFFLFSISMLWMKFIMNIHHLFYVWVETAYDEASLCVCGAKECSSQCWLTQNFHSSRCSYKLSKSRKRVLLSFLFPFFLLLLHGRIQQWMWCFAVTTFVWHSKNLWKILGDGICEFSAR